MSTISTSADSTANDTLQLLSPEDQEALLLGRKALKKQRKKDNRPGRLPGEYVGTSVFFDLAIDRVFDLWFDGNTRILVSHERHEDFAAALAWVWLERYPASIVMWQTKFGKHLAASRPMLEKRGLTVTFLDEAPTPLPPGQVYQVSGDLWGSELPPVPPGSLIVQGEAHKQYCKNTPGVEQECKVLGVIPDRADIPERKHLRQDYDILVTVYSSRMLYADYDPILCVPDHFIEESERALQRHVAVRDVPLTDRVAAFENAQREFAKDCLVSFRGDQVRIEGLIKDSRKTIKNQKKTLKQTVRRIEQLESSAEAEILQKVTEQMALLEAREAREQELLNVLPQGRPATHGVL